MYLKNATFLFIYLQGFVKNIYMYWFCTHMVIPFEQCLYQAVLPSKSIRMVFRGSIDYHLEVSKQGFVLAVLPLERSNQGFVLVDLPFKTIWGINTVHSYFTIQNHNSEWFQIVHQLVWKRYQKLLNEYLNLKIVRQIRRGRCHIGYSPVVPRQSQSDAGLCTFMIAWVPLGRYPGW